MDRELLYRHIRRQTDEDEDRRIAEWLEADPAHREVLDEMLLQWETVSLSACSINAYYERDRQRSLATFVRRWGGAVASAAAVVLLFVGSYFYLDSRSLRQRGAQWMTLEVPSGQHLRMTLPDGTGVWLNAGTTIEYPALFSDRERRVHIDGEARFEVTHDAGHPFIVETYACDVRVLGTKFNVVADREDGIFSTALFSGRVEVRDRTTDKTVVLKPNQAVRMVGGELAVGRIENTDDYLWTEGYINFKGHTFREVIDKYRQVYGVTIRLDDVSVPDTEFQWGKIHIQDGIDNAMRVLQNIYPITYEFTPETRTIVVRNK